MSAEPSFAPAPDWARELTLVALDAHRPGTLADVCRVLGQAAGARGAILWQEEGVGIRLLSVGLEGQGPAGPAALVADPVTLAAFRDRSLVLAGDLPDRISARASVQAALPVDYADGTRGALTLLGERPLSGTAFDVLADLLELLPHVCHAVQDRWQERRALARENESWRRLGAGVTAFNKLLAEQLSGDPAGADDQLVSAAALDMVRSVVQESTGAIEVRDVGKNGTGLARRVHRSSRPEFSTNRQDIVAARLGPDVGWLQATPIRVGERRYGVLVAFGRSPAPPAYAAQVYEIVSDQLGLYRHLQHTLMRLWEAHTRLEQSLTTQARTMEDLKHQLIGPLRQATTRVNHVIDHGRLDQRAESDLRKVRGLCRKATLVATSAGVFATLNRGGRPAPKSELLGADDLIRLLVAAAEDAQVLSKPEREVRFGVDRESVRRLGRRLVWADLSFLTQCVGNLLDNAAKYAYSKTEVAIAAAVPGETLLLTVTSIGIPLDPSDTRRCLERSWRSEAALSTAGDGSGIGLWIVDHLMRSMQGGVRVTIDRDVTAVQLWLPLS